MTALESLGLDGNQITDLSPLSELISLIFLSLDNNRITDLSALSGLTRLQRLGLRFNQIVDIGPLVSNPGLGRRDVLDLYRNPLNEQSRNVHIPALRARGVFIRD